MDQANDKTAGSQQQQCFCMGFGPEIFQMMKKMGPSDNVMGHFRAARVEVLKGIRAMIDERIADLNKASEAANKGTRLNVE